MALNINGTTGISGVDGSVSAPALTGTDSNTGITFPSADTIKFSTGGVERMSITNSGVSGITTGITEADQFILTSNLSVSGIATTVTSNLARSGYSFAGANAKIGTGMSESGGVFTFPSTGKYLIMTCANFRSTNQNVYAAFRGQLSVDNGSNWYYIMVNYASIFDSGSDLVYAQANGQCLVDITDISTHKFRCSATSNSSMEVRGHVNEAFTSIIFARLGDT